MIPLSPEIKYKITFLEFNVLSFNSLLLVHGPFNKSYLLFPLSGNRPEHYRDIPLQSGVDKPPQQQQQHQHGISYGSLMVSTSSFPEDTFSLQNGSLVIRSARKVHQGFYLCDVSNGIGAGLSKVIRLLVNCNSLFSRSSLA
jgi:hypothetical protein